MQIICKWPIHDKNGKIRISAPLFMGVEIYIFLLSSQISTLEPEKGNLVMADLICVYANYSKMPRCRKTGSCSLTIKHIIII